MGTKEKYNVAVAGATGAVGGAMLDVLERRDFPLNELRLLASERSVGKTLQFRDNKIEVGLLSKNAFEGIDLALFSAGASRSLEFAPTAAAAGAVEIDNSSAFRMDDDIPLVVPEVNPHAIARYTNRGIIANPNCSTIQMLVALKPIHDKAGIKRIVVSTYQAVSGTGAKAITGMTISGYTAFKLSSYRPSCNIYIFSEKHYMLSTLSLMWGVHGFYYDKFTTTDETVDDIMQILKENGKVKDGDVIVNTGTMPLGGRGRTNMLKVTVVE